MNNRILKIQEKGLITKWIDNYQSKPRRCLDQLERGYRPRKNPRLTQLTLKNFIGAFVLLFFGYCLSVGIFIYEKFF